MSIKRLKVRSFVHKLFSKRIYRGKASNKGEKRKRLGYPSLKQPQILDHRKLPTTNVISIRRGRSEMKVHPTGCVMAFIPAIPMGSLGCFAGQNWTEIQSTIVICLL